MANVILGLSRLAHFRFAERNGTNISLTPDKAVAESLKTKSEHSFRPSLESKANRADYYRWRHLITQQYQSQSCSIYWNIVPEN